MNREILSCPISQWAGFKEAVKTDRWELSGNVLAWLPGLILTAPIVGYLCALLRLPFGWGAWALIALVSVSLTIPIRQFFKIHTWGELAGLLILMLGIVLGYGAVPVSFEAGSPAAAVWYKSLNLIDGGHLYRSMPWLSSFIGAGVAPASTYEQFGALVPDAQYTFGDLHFMGLPGGAWFFAWWGMIARSLLFAGPLMLMLGTGTILNRLLRHTLPESHWAARLLLALALMAMPIYLYFGRGMVPALYALPLYGIALLFLMKTEWGCGPYPALLIAALTLPILCGTDFILPFFIAVLLLTWHRPAWGLALGAAGVLVFYGLQAAEPLWFGQVVEMPVWVRGIVYFTLGFYLAGLLLHRVLSREDAEKWSRSALVSMIFYAGLLVSAIFLFKKNGAFSNFSALSLVFSGVVLLAGLLTFPAVLKQKRWPLIFRLMAAGLFLSQLIFFKERPIYNLYADYQPYIALLLPLLWLSFGLWIQKSHGWPRYLVLGSLVALMAAQSMGAHLIPREGTAKADLVSFARQCEALGADGDTAVAYDSMDQELTPLLWYGGLTPVPMVQGGEIQLLDAVTGDWLYVTDQLMDTNQAAGTLGYAALPSRQDGLPGPTQIETPWILLDRGDILQEIGRTGSLYPSLTWRIQGTDAVYTDHVRAYGIGVPVEGLGYLLVEGAGEEAAGLADKGLGVCIDGLPLDYAGREENVYYFALPEDMGILSDVDIYIDPLPGTAYEEGTVWGAGMEIAGVRLAGQVPDTIERNGAVHAD